MDPRGLTIDRLRQVLAYDPATGAFTWRLTLSNRCVAGKMAGTVRADGRRAIYIDGRKYYAANLAWAIHTGQFPELEVDHRSRDRSDDRLGNLRLATDLQQAWNAGKRRDNTSGFKGVSPCRQTGLWRAQISSDGRVVNLGRFITAEAASEAYERRVSAERGDFDPKGANAALRVAQGRSEQ